jgi:pyridinium-3,5-biscarboxylic acid mononucleotide sulfurtransferase
MHRTLTIAEPALDAERIVESIRGRGAALVALSGGVDSAVVAALAHRALGSEAVAVTLIGPAVSESEQGAAASVAHEIGIRHALVPADPLEDPDYRANPSNRCFFCRRTETLALRAFGEPRGIAQYLDGVHLDDLGEDRPGLSAMNAAGFLHPLAEAAWRKGDVRSYARTLGLSNAERLSNACLASRVATGNAISDELLRRIGAAEASLTARGFERVRVRVSGATARVEVGPTEVARLLDPELARGVREELHGLGFLDVTLDPNGYRAAKGN